MASRKPTANATKWDVAIVAIRTAGLCLVCYFLSDSLSDSLLSSPEVHSLGSELLTGGGLAGLVGLGVAAKKGWYS